MAKADARSGAEKSASLSAMHPKPSTTYPLNIVTDAFPRHAKPLSVDHARLSARKLPPHENGVLDLPVRDSKPTTSKKQDAKGSRVTPKPATCGQQRSRAGGVPAATSGAQHPRSNQSDAGGLSASQASHSQQRNEASSSGAEEQLRKQQRAHRQRTAAELEKQQLMSRMRVRFLSPFTFEFAIAEDGDIEYPPTSLAANMSAIYNRRHPTLPPMQNGSHLVVGYIDLGPMDHWQLNPTLAEPKRTFPIARAELTTMY